MIVVIEDKRQKEVIASTILADLPEWFGLPDSTAEYVECSKELPFWAEMEGDKAIGFISLKETGKATSEIYVMGVLQTSHGHGIGKKLFEVFYTYAKNQGYSFIQVKTVKEGCYKEYDKTIGFYKKIGFNEFECFPTLWDEWNPCQVFIMAIK